MKRILITTLLALLAGTLNASPMNDGHQLTSLWRQYEEAHNADLPQQEADILAQIKQQAMAKHLPADFYDAATEYVNTVLRRDWTKRDELHAGLKQEVELFGEPIVTFLWMNEWQNASSDYLWKYVKEHPDGFAGLHPELHRNLYSYLGGRLYSAVCDSFASEVSARRNAMDSATKNAGEMISGLKLKYNRARQGAITQEITEIVAGAED